jgi:hypothetical protein
MRITLHAVHAEDYPAFHNAMLSSLRASRLNDRRYTTSGLTYADADRLAPQLLEFADRPRTRAEVDDLLSVHDVAQFTLLRRPVVRDALVTLAADVEQLEGPDGSELFDEAWAGLAAEAGGLVAFRADREPLVYRRYTHWWDKLPGGVVRVLPG